VGLVDSAAWDRYEFARCLVADLAHPCHATGTHRVGDGLDRMRALVLGASGLVGRHLMGRLGPARAIGTFHRHPFPGGLPFDGSDENGIELLLRQVPSDITHAFVLHGTIEVEACARDPAATAELNVTRVGRVLTRLMAAGVTPVYVSSDYVFNGTRGGWRESDPPDPRTQYGKQKLAVERLLLEAPGPSLVIRCSRVIGDEIGVRSVLGPWVEEIRAGARMRCATDQVFSPIAVDDVAGILAALAGHQATGLYHLGGPKPLSRIDLLRLLLASIQAVDAGARVDVVPCSLHDLPFLEKRPLDTSLDIEKLQSTIAWDFLPMSTLCETVAARYFDPRPASA
jgi:dTDP-4-dehydrorhamnose reductase